METVNLFSTTRSQTFLVLGGDQAVQLSPNAGGKIALDDPSGDLVNIADKQLGVVVDKHTDVTLERHFLVNNDTFTAVKSIRLIQGTPNSAQVSNANYFGMGHKTYVQSNPIDLNQELHVVSYPAKQSYSSAWLIGDLAANPGAISVTDNVIYKIRIGFDGRFQNKRNSNSGIAKMFINIKKLPAVATNVSDRFIKRACAQLNKLSSHQGRKKAKGVSSGNKPALCFAVNLAGGAGTSIATIQGAAVGTKYTYEVDGTRTFTFTVTDDLKETLTNAIANVANITAATTIEIIDLTTAGTVAMAAGAAAADAILVLALDSKPALIDDQLETYKTTINAVGLEGFAGEVSRVIASRTHRGYGYGWQLYKMYRDRAQQEIIGGETMPLENRPMSDIPYYMATDNTLYNVHEVWSQDVQYGGFTRFDRRSQVVILQPVADTATTTSLNTGLKVLLQSCPNVTFHTGATAPNVFV